MRKDNKDNKGAFPTKTAPTGWTVKTIAQDYNHDQDCDQDHVQEQPTNGNKKQEGKKRTFPMNTAPTVGP